MKIGRYIEMGIIDDCGMPFTWREWITLRLEKCYCNCYILTISKTYVTLIGKKCRLIG